MFKRINWARIRFSKTGSLRNEEYDYYILSLTDQFDKDNHLIIELEPNRQLDLINNIINDPNTSTTEKNPSIDKYTFKSEHFGDETISINPKNLSQKETFYISVHCKLKCNYIFKAQLMKDIPLKTNDLNVFSINPKTVTKLSFKTMSKNFNELYINIIGTYINSFKVYLYQENPSSSNTLKAQPILFNGYRFTINNDENHINTNKEYNLIYEYKIRKIYY